MLDARTIATTKATISPLVEIGLKSTAHPYNRMFTRNPELKEIFNMGNQRNGDQREVLFNAIATYVSDIEGLAVLLSAVEKIVQKHTNFQVRPGRYDVVGGHLPTTLNGMFNPGQEVLDAWGEAYGALANVFISREVQIYGESVNKNGSWEGICPSRIVTKTPRSAPITSFEFEPVGGDVVVKCHPGQYLGIWPKPEGFPHQEIRQYLLTHKPGGRDYRAVVRREDGGQVSTWLHNRANAGDIAHPVVPAGDFLMGAATDIPVSSISAGIGQTPMLAMLGTPAKARHTVQVDWFHVAENGDVHAFVGEVNEFSRTPLRFSAHTRYCEPTEVDRMKGAPDSVGLMNLNELESVVSDPAIQFYLCSSVGFMQFAARQLVGLGAKDENIHYECSGPHKVL